MISGISHTRIRRRAAAAAIALALASLTACTSGTTPGAGDNSSPPSGAWINGLSGLSAVRLTVADGTDAGAAKGRSLNLPAGWSGQVWANAAGARMAVWTPDGRLIISTGQNGSLALLTPTSRDRAPEVTTLAAGSMTRKASPLPKTAAAPSSWPAKLRSWMPGTMPTGACPISGYLSAGCRPADTQARW